MSDVFNNSGTGRKERILGLLDVQGLPEHATVEGVLHPLQPPSTSQSEYTALDVVHFIREKKLPVFRPRFICEVTPTDLTIDLTTQNVIDFNAELRQKELDRYNKILQEDAQVYFVVPQESVFLPLGTEQRLMSYKPKYYNKPYDVKLLNTITYLATFAPGENGGTHDKYITMTETFHSFLDAIHRKMVSTGTWMGQLNRFAAMRDIRRGLNGNIKPKTLKECGYRMEQFAKILEEVMPITNQLDTFSLNSVPSSWIYRDDDGQLKEELPPIKLRTTGGPPFPSGYKKGAVVTSAVVIMDNILLDCNDVIAGRQTLTDFINKYYYIFCGYMFPKEECYNKSDITNKTRNIISMSIISHMLLAMIWDAPDEASNFNYLNYDTPSLKGFSPWKGGMDLFVRKLLEEPDTFDLVYADNWYIVYKEPDGTFTLFSIDNIKAEANATPDIAQAVNYYGLSRAYITDGNVLQFSATWAHLALNILPATAVDNVAIFRNLQLRVPGLSSGCRVTFHINQAVTAKHRAKWIEAGRPRPGTPEFRAVNVAAGVNVKIELEVPDIKGKLRKMPEDTPRDGILQNPDHETSSSRNWPIVPADLLGYDICYSHELDQYLPVLNSERLMASAAYPKKTNDDIVNYAAYRFYRMARYVTLAMMGAYTQPLLYDACMSLADELRLSLRQTLGGKVFDVASQSSYDDLLPTLVEQLDLTTLNIDFTCNREMLYKLHKSQPQPVPPKASKVNFATLADLREAGKLDRRSNKRMEKVNFSSIPLLSIMIPTMVEQLKAYQVAKQLSEKPWGSFTADWTDDADELLGFIDAEAKVQKSYSSILEQGMKTLETLMFPEVDYNTAGFIPAIYEKDPTKLSNPIIGYHLPYKPTAGILAQRKLEPGVSLSKTQRKNAKRKIKFNQAREQAAALKGAFD